MLFVAHSTHSSGHVRKFHNVSCTAVAVVTHSHLELEARRVPVSVAVEHYAAMLRATALLSRK
eukprot:COSAG02_NODE_9_length_59728_cov_36.104714_21_plen_63_part_00